MVQVGSLTYFVPDMADAVGVFEAATREYTQVDTWRNNLVGGLEHFLFSHILGIVIPID